MRTGMRGNTSMEKEKTLVGASGYKSPLLPLDICVTQQAHGFGMTIRKNIKECSKDLGYTPRFFISYVLIYTPVFLTLNIIIEAFSKLAYWAAQEPVY